MEKVYMSFNINQRDCTQLSLLQMLGIIFTDNTEIAVNEDLTECPIYFNFPTAFKRCGINQLSYHMNEKQKSLQLKIEFSVLLYTVTFVPTDSGIEILYEIQDKKYTQSQYTTVKHWNIDKLKQFLIPYIEKSDKCGGLL